MSSLNSLILEIEKEKEERKGKIVKNHNDAILEIEKKFQVDLDLLNKEIEHDVKKEKEKRISNYTLDKEFKRKMEILTSKEEVLKELVEELKKKFTNSSFGEKKNAYKKRLEEIKDFSSIKKVIVSKKDKEEIKDFFKGYNVEIVEKDLGLFDGFIVEGERFSFDISISSLIDSVIEKNKEKLYKLFD